MKRLVAALSVIMGTSSFVSAQIPTNTTLSSSANPVVAGNPVTFTITVTDGGSTPLTGPVGFSINGQPANDLALSNGVASLQVTFQNPPRTVQVTATYRGDASTAPSSATPLNQVVAAAPGLAATTVSIASSINPAYTYQTITYTATVAGGSAMSPTGTVSFYIGPAAPPIIRPLVNGVATATNTFGTGGNYPISASYSGDSNNQGSSSSTLGQVIQSGGTTGPGGTSEALQFIPITPCRVVDTRNPAGSFGGPTITGGQTRSFPIQNSDCGIGPYPVAYSLNVTAIPNGPLNYLSVWPAGQPQPPVSLLNSPDGRVKANAAIVGAGNGDAINVYAYTPTSTDVIIDINGYFQAPIQNGLVFYPLTPCRLVDTRSGTGPLAGPYLTGGQARVFPISGNCQIPPTAQAYSLNITAIPAGPLGWLTIWPTGQTQPIVSTLNAPTGVNTANAALVPAGTNGQLSVFVTNDADLLLDVNGYFAPPAAGGLSLYTIPPCRVLDTRQLPDSPYPGVFSVDVQGSTCSLPASASAYILNATVIPPAPLNYLTLWPAEQNQPVVSTLNAPDGTITSNMAIVPTTDGLVDTYASNPTQLILDISGYFAP